jgi:1-acyl-sn-glycerol-3-phosphate acyltransferase
MNALQFARRAPGWPAFRTLFWWTFIAFCIRLAFTVVYRLRVFGLNHLPRAGAVMLVANHQSHFDPPLIGALASDRPMAPIAREGLFSFKPFGAVLRSIGVIAISQERSDHAAVRAALAELEAGRNVLMFPEGSRSPDGEVAPFMRGVMVLLKRARVPVVPVAVEGAFDVWPRTMTLPRASGRIAVMFGPVISFDEMLADGPEGGLQRLQREIDDMRRSLRRMMRHQSHGRYPAPRAPQPSGA